MTTELIIKFLADGLVVVVALLATATLLVGVPNNRKFEAYSRILMAGLTAYLVAKLVGSLYQPEAQRPFELLGMHAGASYIDNPGFPSDHAVFAMALSLAVWFETRYKKFAGLLFGLTILMCIGRVLALVHTPIDVVGGVVIALTGAVWYRLPRRKQIVKNNHKNIRSQKTQH